MTPVVRHMVSAIADRLPLLERIGLRATLVPRLTNRVLDLFGDDGRALYPLLHNTATPTVINGGDSTNVIPTEITLDLDGRLLPGQRPADLIRELDALAPGRVRYEVVREEPAVPAEPDMTLLSTLGDVLRDHDPAGTPFPVLLPGYTDARHFARLGIQTYGYLPLRLPRTITMALIHGPDERVPVDALRFGVACLKDTLRQISTA